jgi:hypothetical protein
MQFFGFIFRLFLRWGMKQYCASKVVCIYELPLQSMHACRLESVTNPTQQHPLGMLGVPSCQGMEPHLVDGGIYKNLPIWRELEFFMASSKDAPLFILSCGGDFGWTQF